MPAPHLRAGVKFVQDVGRAVIYPLSGATESMTEVPPCCLPGGARRRLRWMVRSASTTEPEPPPRRTSGISCTTRRRVSCSRRRTRTLPPRSAGPPSGWPPSTPPWSSCSNATCTWPWAPRPARGGSPPEPTGSGTPTSAPWSSTRAANRSPVRAASTPWSTRCSPRSPRSCTSTSGTGAGRPPTAPPPSPTWPGRPSAGPTATAGLRSPAVPCNHPRTDPERSLRPTRQEGRHAGAGQPRRRRGRAQGAGHRGQAGRPGPERPGGARPRAHRPGRRGHQLVRDLRLHRPPPAAQHAAREGRRLPVRAQLGPGLRAGQRPGAPLVLPDHHPRILDGRSFWTAGAALSAGGPVEVCVVGSGETAGSITSALVGLLPEGSVIELVSDHGVLYTRGESFTENRMYSDPDAAGWRQLAERHRREFLKRTDRGVFSVQVQELLDRAGLVRTLAGRVTHLEPVEAKVVVEVDYDQRRERLAFDWVVVAVGFDPLWFVSLFGRGAHDALAEAVGEAPGRPPTRAALERVIGHDLAVPGLRPRLHLPILAGLAQGPGFPNLSCLGLLADRVLGAYVDVRRPDHQGLGVARRPTTGGATSGGPRGG